MDLHQLDEIDRLLLAEAATGKDAEEFRRSPVGQYMAGCAKQEMLEAIEDLSSIAFFKFWRIIQLQNKVWRARSFLGWLEEMEQRGRIAEGELHRRFNDDDAAAE